jgi:hypothetical protein
MKLANGSGEDPLCPSAQPEMAESVIFGVVGGTAEEPRVGYLLRTIPTSKELLEMTEPVNPTEVFRFAAPCARNLCKHFDGSNCQLVTRVVRLLPEAVGSVPPCKIRPNCQWWQQEGVEACLRCPLVVTEVHQPSALQYEVSGIAP